MLADFGPIRVAVLFLHSQVQAHAERKIMLIGCDDHSTSPVSVVTQMLEDFINQVQ